jgi:peptide/nickel transport system permease protein
MPWIARRIGVAVLLVWASASIVFLAVRLVPGDPAARPDRSVLTQYFDDFANLLTGDLGRSLQDGSPVAGEIGERLPRTLELIGFAAVLAILIGIPGGLFAAIGRHSGLERVAISLSTLALAVPVFVVGTLLVLLFGQPPHAVSAGGYLSLADDPLGHIAMLTMPAVTIAVGLSATVFRLTRIAVLDVIQRDFVRTAWAKGLGPARILLHHILRNALPPVMTALARQLGILLGTAILAEYVFSYPGLAGLLVEAASARDYPIVAGVVLVAAVLFVLLNLAADLLRAALDPRVRTA